MTNRTATPLAWSLWGLVIALIVGGAVLSFLNRSTLDSTTEGWYLMLSLSAIGFGTAGALVAVRHRDNPIGWLFLAMGAGFVAGEFAEEYAVGGMIDRLEALGGSLDVQSQPGQGTTVAGRLPLRRFIAT